MKAHTNGFAAAQAAYDHMTQEPSGDDLAFEDWKESNGVIELIGHEAANDILASICDGNTRTVFLLLEIALQEAWAKRQKERREDVDFDFIH